MASYPPAGGPRLADFLDGLPILTRWMPGHRIVWQTGQQDGPDLPQPERHTHCSAFAAAVALYLDIYLLRPPHHGQVQLANAQTDWLSGNGSFPGPTAASADWTALGMSGDQPNDQSHVGTCRFMTCPPVGRTLNLRLLAGLVGQL